MKKIAVLRDPPSDEAELIVKEMEKKAEVEVILREHLSYPMKIESNTLLRWDSVEKRKVRDLVPFLEILEREKKIINSVELIRIGENKGLMGYIMEKNNIPTPKFSLVDTKEEMLKHANRIGYPVVVKPADGTGGWNVMKFEDEEQLEKNVEKILSKNIGAWVVQEYIEKKENRDIRVVVVGGEVSIAFYRIGKTWITNLHQGAKMKEFDGEEEVLELAQKAAEAFGDGIFGFDILESEEGYYVCEINMKPGMPVPSAELTRKMSKDIADYVLEVSE